MVSIDRVKVLSNFLVNLLVSDLEGIFTRSIDIIIPTVSAFGELELHCPMYEIETLHPVYRANAIFPKILKIGPIF